MVAVKAGDVDRALRAPGPEVCLLLLYGPDAGRVAERARAAAEGAASDPTDPFQLVRLSGDDLADQPGRLLEEASTFGLFGGRRVLWVRPTSRNIAPAVSVCLEAAPPETLIVIEAGDLARTAPLRTACERSPRALALPCYADQARDLAAMINDMLQADGLAIDPDARALLVDSLGGDRLASRGEVAKLALYARGRGTVTAADVEAVVSDVSSLDLDGAIDAAFQGRPRELDEALAKLWQHGSASHAVLSAAIRHALALLAGCAAREAGLDLDTALRSWRGLHFRRRDAVGRQIAMWSPGRLAPAIADLQRASLTARQFASISAAVTSATLARVAERGARLLRR